MCRIFFVWVSCALLFPVTCKADVNPTAFVQGSGVAANAGPGAVVYIDNSKHVLQNGSKDDARRIAELELQLRLGRDEISRLSRDEEGEILRRSREDLLKSLPAEIRKLYEEGNWQAVVNYLESTEKGLASKENKINLARAKALYELALVSINFDHVQAFEYLRRSLDVNANFFPSIMLYVQLASRLGRVDEVRRMLNSLRQDGRLNSIDLKYLQDAKAGLTSFFVDAAGMYLTQHQWSQAEEIIRAGRDIAISAKNRGDNSLLDLDSSLGLLGKWLNFRRERAGLFDEYSFYSRELSGFDYSFEQCKDCRVYASLVVGFNFALISYAQSIGDLEPVRETFERLDKISVSQSLPGAVVSEIQLQKLISAARGSKLVGAREKYEEYSEKAKNLLRENLDKEIYYYDRWLDLLDISLGQVDVDIDLERKAEAIKLLDGVGASVRGVVAKTKGYEVRHFDLYLRLGDQNSLLGRIAEAEHFYDMADKVSSEFKSSSFAYLKSRRGYFNSLGYHWLRNGAGEKANSAAEEIARFDSALKKMDETIDESEWLELSARASLAVGSCERFQSGITEALNVYVKNGIETASEIAYLARLRRLLKVSQGCLPYGDLSEERYQKLFAYTDAIFLRRPWDQDLVDDLIYSLNGLGTGYLISKKTELSAEYVEVLRNRMGVCSRYLLVAKKCKSQAAYSLAMQGIRRMPDDNLMMERALTEFNALEKGQGLDSQSRQLFISFVILYAQVLNFNEARDKYVSLLREADRLFQGLPMEIRTKSMIRWYEQLQVWFATDMKREFSRRSWLFFE